MAQGIFLIRFPTPKVLAAHKFSEDIFVARALAHYVNSAVFIHDFFAHRRGGNGAG